MPTVLVEKGYYFRFYASDMGEPPHIHVVQGRKRAKIWLQDMSLAETMIIEGSNSMR